MPEVVARDASCTVTVHGAFTASLFSLIKTLWDELIQTFLTLRWVRLEVFLKICPNNNFKSCRVWGMFRHKTSFES